ncbi:MKI67 FHA domain-interacting nucleolar phosphoprotein [Hoplias malabaricus]|uniref:MKI67 FHA domain-interacting nucleolar phosphoprotein n=1 Tax=Hoplias malabaricus TaxID=27720 RepID=UPI003463008E
MTEENKSSKKKSSQKLLALNPAEDSEFRKKVQKVKSRPQTSLQPGVIYMGHIPRALAEPQLREYFSQFGKVLRLRLSRSKKTGQSKGYAFVEFACDEVAKIVAETMDNYLMGERLIKCHVVPPEEIHEKLFVGCQRVFTKPIRPAASRYNRGHGPEEMKKMTSKLLRKESKLRKRLAEKGIDYDFPGFAAQVKAKKTQSGADTSVCSEDATPVCTPSVLEKRRSMKVDDDDVDDEVIVKPQCTSENNECEEDTEEEDTHNDDDESEEE